jgi:hypothetical protein
MASEHDPVLLEVAKSVVDADIVAAALKAEGIPVYVAGAVLSDELASVRKVVGGVGTDIFVAKKDVERARAVVAKTRPKEGGGFWTCAACGERVESQFEACWKCEATMPDGVAIETAEGAEDAAVRATKDGVSESGAATAAWPVDLRSPGRATADTIGVLLWWYATWKWPSVLNRIGGFELEPRLAYGINVFAYAAPIYFFRNAVGANLSPFRFGRDVFRSSIFGAAIFFATWFLWDGWFQAVLERRVDLMEKSMSTRVDLTFGLFWKIPVALVVLPAAVFGFVRLTGRRFLSVILGSAAIAVALPLDLRGFYWANSFVEFGLASAALFIHRSRWPVLGAVVLSTVATAALWV